MLKNSIIILFIIFSFPLSAQKRVKDKDNKFTYLYSDALKYKFDGNLEEAAALFKECLQLKPESSASLYQLSIIYFRQKKFDFSYESINQALNLVPDNEWYLLQKAELAKVLGYDDEFTEVYEKLNKYFPDNPEYAYKLALIYYKQNKYDEAIKLLNAIENTTGVVENISFLKNNIFYKQQRYDLLLAELKKLVSVFPDSVKYVDMLAKYYSSMRQSNKALLTYQNALKTFPGNKRLFLSLSDLYADMQNYGDGFIYLLKGIGAQDVPIQNQIKIAQNYLNTNELDNNRKIQIYDSLINYFPDNYEVQTAFIEFLLRQKENALALKKLNQILRNYPDNFTLWTYLFDLYAADSRYDSLKIATEKALEYYPNQSIVYFYSGFADFYLHKYQSAVSNLETGLDYLIDNKDLEKQFYLYLAESYHALQNHQKSDLYFDKYLSLDRMNPYVLNNYAYYLSERKTFLDRAFLLAKSAIEIDPFNASFLDTYAWILYLQGDIKNALFNIQKAYKYGGASNSVICTHYALILLKSGDKHKAARLFKEALNLDPDNDFIKEQLQLLDE